MAFPLQRFLPRPEFRVLQKTKSISFSSSIDDRPLKKFTTQSFQEANLLKPKKASPVNVPPSSKHQCKNISTDEKKEAIPSSRIRRLFSSSGLGDSVVNDADHQYEEGFGFQTLVVGGGMGSGDGGAGGRGSDGGDSIDAYYQRMISADPGNALLLGNYAKLLKEVRGDLEKAEEFYGRANLANPNDGNILSLYGDLVWEKDKYAQRAENYFDGAVKTASQDCLSFIIINLELFNLSSSIIAVMFKLDMLDFYGMLKKKKKIANMD